MTHKFPGDVILVQVSPPFVVLAMNIADKTVPKYNEADIIVKNKDYAESMADVFDNVWERSFTTEQYKKGNY